MNTVTLIGRISEPKVMFTKTGTALITFGLATSRKVNNEEKTTWHNVKAWGELAEGFGESFDKGSRVIIHGELTQESYTDKEGNERKSVVVVARDGGLSCRFPDKEPSDD